MSIPSVPTSLVTKAIISTTSSTSVSLKTVVFVVTRKPLARASFIASTATFPEARVVADVVVDLAHAVEMHDEREARVGRELGEHLAEAQRVRAQLHVSLHLDEARDYVFDALEDERLATADGDDGGRALLGRADALLDGQPRLIRLVLAILPQPMQAMLQPRVGSSMTTSG